MMTTPNIPLTAPKAAAAGHEPPVPAGDGRTPGHKLRDREPQRRLYGSTSIEHAQQSGE
jgi:hypothetical protein